MKPDRSRSSQNGQGEPRPALDTPLQILLRARIVLPISRAPIENGYVLIRGGVIHALGRWNGRADPSTAVVDLGDVVLLPGLVNAHCHLDYTDMAGQFAPPKIFSDWLKLITESKSGWNLGDYQKSWRNGARMLLQTGTTTVADIEAVPELLPAAWAITPLRVISFLEMIGLTPRRSPRMVLAETLGRIRRWKVTAERAGLSPHAPYSTVPELLRLTAVMARKEKLPVAIHVAESATEFEMFKKGCGELHQWLKSTRDMSDCGCGTPVGHLERCGLLGPNVTAIHANYLGRGDAALLAKRGASVAHCPRSHQYFRHAPFPLQRLVRAGVNVCLGTDSLASVCKNRRQPLVLSMFEEMRALATAFPSLRAEAIVRMATVNGARALGLSGKVGELAPGAAADLVTLPYSGKVSAAGVGVLSHRGQVSSSMIAGVWRVPPPHTA